MASIADKMTLASWFKAKTDHIIDFSDEFMWATFLHRGVNDDATLVADTDEKTRDLILADAYYGAAVSSTRESRTAAGLTMWLSRMSFRVMP